MPPFNHVEDDEAEALRARVAELEQELREARARLRRLEEVERVQSDFTMAISHELRTPLTLISGYAQTLLLRWGRTDDERRHAMVEKINISSHRLTRLVEDILLLTDVEQGTLPMHIKNTGIAEVVAEALRELRDRYPRGLPAIDLSETDEHVLADAFRLEQVLINLLDNAVKHTPLEAAVGLRWRRAGEQVVIEVSDQGGGIDPADIPRLFTRFGRLEHVVGQSLGGVGLGLYIARQLVEAMQGRIWVDSAFGAGSTFYVALPAAPDAP